MGGAFASLGSAMCWACASLLFARLGKQTHPAAMNFLKCAIALLLMMGTMVAMGASPWPWQATTRELGLLAGSGLIGLALGDTAYFQALVRLGPRRTLLLSALVPVMTTLMGFLVLNEPITNSLLLGMTLTVGGVVWVIRERRLPTAPEPGGLSEAEIRQSEKIGLGFALLAALCQSSGQLLTRSASADLSAMELSIIRLAAGVVGIMVQLVILRKIAAVATPFRHSHPAITLLIATFLGTYCGVWLMNYGLQNLSSVGVASTLNSTSPIFILPLSALVLGEKVSSRAIFGAIFAVAGIAILALGATQ